MEFVLNGRTYSISAEQVRTRLATKAPDPIRTHWVDVEGRRWPPKQALRIVASLGTAPFISHFAIRIFRRLGFETSPLPGEGGHGEIGEIESARPAHSDSDALDAFRRLDGFMAANQLTSTLAGLESRLVGLDATGVRRLVDTSGFDENLVDSALVVRERVGMVDTLIHAAVIAQVLPMIMEEGETVTKRPSLGAGNDSLRVFDVETDRRVAEFKLSSWKGGDGMRQRSLFADVVGLSLDATGRRREVYVVGELPVRFLTTSHRNAVRTLSKSAQRVRSVAGLTEATTVAEFTQSAGVRVVDLRTLLPGLR